MTSHRLSAGPPVDRTVTDVPELPEVETLRRHLAPRIEGERILAAWSDAAPKYASAASASGSTVESVGRRGKFLILGLGDRLDLIIHLGMTGQLHWDREPDDHVRAWFRFAAGTLWFRDPRRFGRAAVVGRGEATGMPALDHLGPDVSDPSCTAEVFAAAVAGSGAPVKARLLDQRRVAGVGNYLADEALFASRLHPMTRHVDDQAAARLHAALVDLVARSLAAGGMSSRDYVHLDGTSGGFAAELQVYGRSGSPCPACQATLERIQVAGRSSTFCPVCQPLQRRLPRRRPAGR